MTQTNTDYLFQITPAATDRTYGAVDASDGAGRFDDHLSQAATYSGEDSPNRGSSSQRSETARYDRDDGSWNTSASKPSNRDSGGSNSSPATPSNRDESGSAVSGSKASSDNADADEHDTEESDDTTAAEVAGAGQTAPSGAKKSESKTNSDTTETAKAAAVSKKSATETRSAKAAGNVDGQATSGSLSADAITQHAEEVAKLKADQAAADETSEEDEPQTATGGERSKAAKNTSSTAKSGKGVSADSDSTACSKLSVDGTEGASIAPDAANKIDGTAEASAVVASATTKAKSDVDESSDDDSRTGSQNDSRVGARNDASSPTNKVDTAQLAGGIPNLTDTGANAASKGKDDEQAPKPIAAKGEPVAAAFARMTRNNLTGASDSKSGTNDLPQVDPSRFIGRVAKAFQTAQDRGGTLQLRLSPPELGALRIELNVKDGVMSASLQTENANARRLLLDHLPALRDRLAEQNIRVDRFDVDVRDGSSGQTDARGSQQQQFQNMPDDPAPRRQAPQQSRTRDAAPERTVVASKVSSAGLNLIV